MSLDIQMWRLGQKGGEEHDYVMFKRETGAIKEKMELEEGES